MMNIDLNLTIWIQSFFGTDSRLIWEVITNLGSAPFLILVVGMVMWLKGTSHGLRILFAFMFSAMTVAVMKVLILQPRPYYIQPKVQPWHASDGFGMPSGHAGGAMGLWGTLVVSLRKGWVTVLAVVLILLIGLSRVYFGVHSPSQVLVGWGIGLLVMLAIWRWERPIVAAFKSVGLWGQIGLAVVMTLSLVGLQTTFIATRATTFEIPTPWIERFQDAQRYEASLSGSNLTEFEPLHLFSELDVVRFSSFFGMWLVAIYAANWGSFDGFTRRQQGTNVVLGLILVGILVGLTQVTKGIMPIEAILWVALPVILGIGVPLIGSRLMC